MKRSENRGLCGSAGLAVVDGVYEHRHTERVRKQDVLLTLVVAHLTGTRQKLNRGEPLSFGGLDLATDRMNMGDDRRHDLFEPRMRTVRQQSDYCLGGGRAVKVR